MKEERREIIKNMFRTKGEVKLKELEERFPGCSSMTLRRDIISLEEEGLVKRTRGGAVAMHNLMIVTEAAYHKRAAANVEAKEEIARKAAAFFEQGCSLFIDAGSTMMYLAEKIPDEYCSVTTSGVNVSLELMKKKYPIITLLGGQLNKSSLSVAGVNSTEYLSQINIDIAFMASSGCTFESGFTCGTYTECGIKKEVIKNARKKIVLMDYSKFGKNMPFTFAGFDDVDVVISDSNMDPEMAEGIRMRGVELL